MDLSDIYNFLRENFTLEDIFLLILLVVIILEKKCDKIFIAMLVFIFIVGIKKDLLSVIFKSDFLDFFKLFSFI